MSALLRCLAAAALAMAMCGSHTTDPPSSMWSEETVDLVSAKVPGVLDPPDTVQLDTTGTYAYCFDASTEESLLLSSKPPDTITAPDLTIQIALHFVQAAAGTGNVVWQYAFSRICPSVAMTTGSVSITCPAVGTIWHGAPVCYSSEIVYPNTESNCVTSVTLSRDATNAADTFGGDACLPIASIYRKIRRLALPDPDA